MCSKINNFAVDTINFHRLSNPKSVLPVLDSRHPYSCFVYNQVIKQEYFKDVLDFYSIGDNPIDSNSWIVTRNIRQDNGINICISAPTDIATGVEEIPKNIIQCFSSGGGLIDWTSKLEFVALCQPLSKMIFEISAFRNLNLTQVHPCFMYYMNVDDALKLDTERKSIKENIQIKRLSAGNKDEDFIVSTWAYFLPETRVDIKNYLVANASGGVFIDDKCVSGVYMAGYGILSALHTLKEYRRNGFARLSITYAFREMAKDGCIPCCLAECRSEKSVAFHENFDEPLKKACIVYWIDARRPADN